MSENGSSDANVVIECLQRTLMNIDMLRPGGLTDVALWQLDNCFRENKNTYLLCYAGWLCERRVFRVTYISFHPVGHTHNECDQAASRITVAARNNDIFCPCGLHKVLKYSYSPRPHVEFIDKVADFKRMVNPANDKHFSKASGSLMSEVSD